MVKEVSACWRLSGGDVVPGLVKEKKASTPVWEYFSLGDKGSSTTKAVD